MLSRIISLHNYTDWSGDYEANVRFYIHIDKAVDDIPFRELLFDVNNVFFLVGQKRKSIPWSDIKIVDVTLAALRSCTQDSKSKGYFVLLSGSYYPIVENKFIHCFFQTNYGKNCISIADFSEIWPHYKMRFERYNFHLPKQRTEHGIYPISDARFFSFKILKKLCSLHLTSVRCRP